MHKDGTFLKPLVIRDGDWLNECPHCGGNNLHHADVSVFNPDGYGDEWNEKTQSTDRKAYTRVTHVMSDNTITSARVHAEATNNPSRDRNGLLVEFWCEGCEEKPMLAIVQHKGVTFIGWRQD